MKSKLVWMVRICGSVLAFHPLVPHQSLAESESSGRNWPGSGVSTFVEQQPPNDVANHVRAARAANQSGDARQEVKEWTAVITLAPKDSAAFYYRAAAYDELTLYSKAIADATEYVRREPNDPKGWRQLAILRADGGQIQEGIKACQHALRIDPNNALSHAMLADIYRLNKQWSEALQEAAKAQELDPKLPRAYQVMGRVYEEQKEYRKAAKAFSRVIKLNPDWPNALVARGDASLDAGEYRSASADYREAVKRFPGSSRCHAALAYFLSACPAAEWRNGKEALVEAKIACAQTDWKDPYAIASLGTALAETGDFAEAIRRARQVLAMTLPRDREDFQKELDTYQKGKPWREQL